MTSGSLAEHFSAQSMGGRRVGDICSHRWRCSPTAWVFSLGTVIPTSRWARVDITREEGGTVTMETVVGTERDLSSEEVTSMDQAAFNTTTQWTTFGEDDQLHTKVIKDST